MYKKVAQWDSLRQNYINTMIPVSKIDSVPPPPPDRNGAKNGHQGVQGLEISSQTQLKCRVL